MKKNNIDKQRYLVKPEEYEGLKIQLEKDGYYSLTHLPDGTVAGLQSFIFTTGLMTGLTSMTYAQRFCYEHQSDAQEALDRYKAIEDDAEGPWIKAKGLDLGDRINPLWANDEVPPCRPLNKASKIKK